MGNDLLKERWMMQQHTWPLRRVATAGPVYRFAIMEVQVYRYRILTKWHNCKRGHCSEEKKRVA